MARQEVAHTWEALEEAIPDALLYRFALLMA
jgi:hypothetical protein